MAFSAMMAPTSFSLLAARVVAADRAERPELLLGNAERWFTCGTTLMSLFKSVPPSPSLTSVRKMSATALRFLSIDTLPVGDSNETFWSASRSFLPPSETSP